MNVAQALRSPQINLGRVIEKAKEMVEMMRGCHYSLDPDDKADLLKLARALRTVLDKSELTLKEIGYTAAEINAMIVAVPDRTESVSSFGFLLEQMSDETAAISAEDLEEVDAELVEEDETEERGEISKVRRKPEGHQSLICGNTREPHVRADMAALLGDLSDEQLSDWLTERFNFLLQAG